MKKLFFAISCLMLSAGLSEAQKGSAEPNDYYPFAYTRDTWTGEVTAFDNDRRTLTLTYIRDKKKVSTFVASVPDAPYEWGRDARKFRVVDFPFDKEAKSQMFKYIWAPGVSVLPPEQTTFGTPVQNRPNPPASNVISDFTDLMGRTITVYYTTRSRIVDGKNEEYHDLWRIRILSGKKS